jgi:hypothetical protein
MTHAMHPKAPAAPNPEGESRATVPSLDDLLVMAEDHSSGGSPRQAEGIFWALAEEHSGTAQAGIARRKLRALAYEYERGGCTHEARAIHERLIYL